ncbi:YycH family regulatory protein [Bacillus pinisoli]|uniref:YycH family regulatory protein n=1 Tax=Bacillus pinisoli TaxID=2901866 RepID=UPI001FF3FDA1|nr:two-component system activity regulator YycH [Bacillus pinisoli]
MNYENIKSFLLTMLVILSLFLTWSIWAYQPNLGVIERTEFVSDVMIGEKRDAASLILPEQVLFHRNGNHYGTTDNSMIRSMMQYMKQWKFGEITDITTDVGEDFLSYVHDQDGVEVIFPSELAKETYNNIISFDDDGSSSITFDRLIVPMNESQQEETVAYFVSYKNKYIYQTTITNFSYKNFNKDVYQLALIYPSFTDYVVTDKHRIFLQSEPVKANRITYYSIKYSGEDFKEALFTDQSSVKRDIQSTGEETYSDGSRALFINSTGDMLQYINPSAATDRTSFTIHDTIQKSIDFINDHSGWTDNYQLSGVDPIQQSATFRLFIDGLPVYNYSGMSRMKLGWNGTNSFNTYIRPLFKLHLSIDSESSQVDLPSGKAVMDLLGKIVDVEKIEEAKVAYELKKDFSSAKVTVEPIWVIKYKNQWNKVMFDENIKERGGAILVLE